MYKADKHIGIEIIPILSLVLMPILSLYAITSWLSLGNVVLLSVLSIRLFLHDKGKLKIQSLTIFLFFFFLALYNYVVSIANQGNAVAMSNSLMIILFSIELLLIENNEFSVESIYPVARLITIVIVLFLFLQVLSYYTLGSNAFSGRILPLELMEKGYFKMEMRGRPSSFLPEPAHLSIFISPVYLYSLQKREWKTIIICLIGLILSTSSTGLIIAAVLPIISFLLASDMTLSKKALFATVTLGFVVIIYFAVSGKYYNNFSNKLNSESFENNIRLFGQLENMKILSLSQWATGIGLNNWRDYLSIYGIQSSNYSNSLFFSIISFGFIGTISLVIGLLKLIEFRFSMRSQKVTLAFLILLLIVIFSDQVLFNRNLLYLLTWMLAIKQVNYEDELKIQEEKK